MDQNEIFKIVRSVIMECLETSEDITLHTRFNDLSNWSSIIYIMVITTIEEKLNIMLSPDELFDVEDVDGLVNLILKSLKL